MTEKKSLPSEELPLTITPASELREHKCKRPNEKLRFLILATICFLVLQLNSQILSLWRQNHAKHTSYPGEHIKWEQCGELIGRPLECSSIDVPMDQFNPNDSNKTFTIPLIRLRGKNATQNLLINPGGPGGSGLAFLHRRGEQLNAIVGEGYHILSFDPRGINSSTPQALCYPDKESREKLSDVRFARLVEDSPEMYAWTRNLVQACQDTTGEHGKYINTPQTAADMNSILDAVGQEEMVYWGFSYGTLLGQTYAGLYPERSKRVIIDGVVNQFDWYEGRFDNEALTDTENVLAGFYEECIKAGPENCTLASLADSKEELSDLVDTFMEKVKEEPISAYINATAYGLLTHGKIWNKVLFQSLYKPAAWYETADNLAQLIQGNATAIYKQLTDESGFGGQAWDANRFVTANDGLSGPEHWPTDRQSLLEEIIPSVNLSSFGVTGLPTIYTKQQWLYPRTHSYKPVRGVKTAGPVLILSTSWDPVCPLVSARSAHEAFEGSQMVEIKGYGHCSVAVTSLCANKVVREFLYEGKVPEKYTECEVDSPYFVKPGEDSKALARARFTDPEEQRVHAAQLELARDWEFS
jgi:pimeloyl-ACP methyl ester carboxylesterase